MPVGMSLFLPPDVMAAIADLAESQRELSEQFGRLAKTMEGWMKGTGRAGPTETTE